MIRAFAFLILTTTRNKLLAQVRRLRTPRYAIGLALGLGYFWMVFGRHAVARQAVAPAAGGNFLEPLAPLFVLIIAAGIWLFGGDRSALAFSEAEVSMLLSAPVSRRGLIVYKLAQSQIALVLNALIWVFLLRRGNSALPSVLSAAAIWIAFTTLNLHRMGAALVRASQVEYRAAGRGEKWAKGALIILFMVLALAAIVGPSVIEAPQPGDTSDPFAVVRSAIATLSSARAQMILLPFHWVVAPIFARSIGAWASAMLPALGIMLLHVAWVLRSDSAFEEAAALASTERAKRLESMRTRRTAPPVPTAKDATKTLQLASSGRPAIAIVWKNTLALKRTFKPGTILRLLFIMVIVPAVVSWKTGDPARTLLVLSIAMAALVPLFLIQLIRTDLRSDMMHLPFLKSLPLSGTELVLAEVAPVAFVMAAVQFVLFAIAGVAFAMSSKSLHLPAGMALGMIIAAPVVLLALDGTICMVMNGSAVLFPAWQRLGPAGPGGVEMMGQTMLSMIGSAIVFLLLLLIPVFFGAGAYFALSSVPALAAAAAGLVGATSLLGENYAMILALGRAFERAEPQQIA